MNVDSEQGCLSLKTDFAAQFVQNRWVLSNHEANKALTEQQRATLTMPFFAWDPQSLRLERGDYPGMAERLERETSFIAQVETVLNDVVKHLPDLSRPM